VTNSTPAMRFWCHFAIACLLPRKNRPISRRKALTCLRSLKFWVCTGTGFPRASGTYIVSRNRSELCTRQCPVTFSSDDPKYFLTTDGLTPNERAAADNFRFGLRRISESTWRALVLASDDRRGSRESVISRALSRACASLALREITLRFLATVAAPFPFAFCVEDSILLPS
jgi:hypothetical protein